MLQKFACDLRDIACIFVLTMILAASCNSDGQCCRKRIQCFDCDSRYDPRCGDPFNLTESTGMMVFCDDLCVKLKHNHNGHFYFIRSCADQFKKIQIKKTDVCYSTRAKDGSNLCFCEHDLCNGATPVTVAGGPYRIRLFLVAFVLLQLVVAFFI